MTIRLEVPRFLAGTLEEMVYARQIYKQQAANTAIEGARERRYFEGVKGVPGHEGELWGLANLFKLTAETVATRDIITAAERKELNYSIEAFDADTAGMPSAVPSLLSLIACISYKLDPVHVMHN